MRSHTLQVVLAVLIVTGIGAHWMESVQEDQSSRSFAHWLTTMVKNRDDARMLERIRDLKQNHQDLNRLVKEASKLVSEHNSEFDLPLKPKGPKSDDVSEILLVKWNLYKKVGGMGQATQKPANKPVLQLPADYTFEQHELKTKFHKTASTCRLRLPSRSIHPEQDQLPMSGGRAIGAP